MKTRILVNTALLTGSFLALTLSGKGSKQHEVKQAPTYQPSLAAVPDAVAENTIQVALLLDTSNSMDGLIEQAKSRLWNIVNTLSTLKYDGRAPKIEIALYEYGNDGLRERNWIRKVTPLTQDLDLISEKLFSLRTNGGTEYCGAVIKDAVSQLEWNGNTKAMKLIYIAGNEPFNQEGINYKEAISDAQKKKIFVNTIFCGDRKEGIETYWQDGAVLGGGKYFNIDSNQKVIFIETPYDIRISALNLQLNDTYIGYGATGYEKKASQAMQDVNAASLSKANAVERTVSKSKKEAYRAESWDLVDKAESDRNFVNTMKSEDLPAELKGKSKTEIAKIVSEKSRQRSQVQREITELAIKRQNYIDEEIKKRGNSTADDLGKAMEKSIQELGRKNGFTF
ncbi:MAG: VWA domain-containing protein [Weeksellaceae bacterium]|nr:VWA domain-containing protein [Weeksellaceae bacterium]